ncbi:MAG: hypothetical protein GC204_00055 [Chloroflexi bacterium]|nr:hypothetical protein [Chloroflexota bacterium]
MKHISRFLPVALALMLVFTGVDKKGSFDITAGSGTGKGGDVPVVPGFAASDDISVSAGGTTKGGDVPVIPG